MARLRVERAWEGWIQGIGVRCRVGGRMRSMRNQLSWFRMTLTYGFCLWPMGFGVPLTEADMPDQKVVWGSRLQTTHSILSRWYLRFWAGCEVTL